MGRVTAVHYDDRGTPRLEPEAVCRDCGSTFALMSVSGGYLCMDARVCQRKQEREAS